MDVQRIKIAEKIFEVVMLNNALSDNFMYFNFSYSGDTKTLSLAYAKVREALNLKKWFEEPDAEWMLYLDDSEFHEKSSIATMLSVLYTLRSIYRRKQEILYGTNTRTSGD